MEKDNNDIDKILEEIMDLTSKGDAGPDNLFADDNEYIEVMRASLETRLALLEQCDENKPDINAEWEKFSKKKEKRSFRKIYLYISTAAIAASLILFFYLNINQPEPDYYFTATVKAPQVILQKSNGETLALNGYDQAKGAGLKDNGVMISELNILTYKNDITEEEKTETHILSTPRGMDFCVELSDGTMVWLNADSKLEYPSKFSDTERIVILEGEAYFSVAKDAKRPFIIKGPSMETKVLGTEFNIHNYVTGDAHLTLVNGKVEVKGNDQEKYISVLPGENAKLKEDGTFELKEVDVDSYTYWKEGYFYYDDTPLESIVQELGRWYNVNIVFENETAKEFKIHYACNRKDNIEKAVSLLDGIEKLNVKFENNTIYIE